jgi:hypothetical protein
MRLLGICRPIIILERKNRFAWVVKQPWECLGIWAYYPLNFLLNCKIRTIIRIDPMQRSIWARRIVIATLGRKGLLQDAEIIGHLPHGADIRKR